MINSKLKPIVAIVGRPNVGKSTLFNRLTKSRKALVHGQPGVTRDRKYGDVEWMGKIYAVVDTGGVESGIQEGLGALSEGVRSQARVAVEEADLILLVVDGRAGVVPADVEIAEDLRKSGKRPVIVVNKVDGPGQENLVADFYSLGLEPLITVSSEHGRGISQLLDQMEESLEPWWRSLSEEGDGSQEGEGEDEGDHDEDDYEEKKKSSKHRTRRGRRLDDVDDEVTKVAILGKPNVGKSTLVNRFLGQERMLVSDIPGTTRDSVDVLVELGGMPYLLVDTAGLRRKAKVRMCLEKWANSMALRTVEKAHVCLLVMDATEGPTDQDVRIVSWIEDKGRALVVVLNKWDLLDADRRRRVLADCKDKLSFTAFTPIVFISALTGRRIGKVLEAVNRVRVEQLKRISTGELNRQLTRIEEAHRPATFKGRPVKLFYATQVSVVPPTIAVFTNHPEGITPQYERYVISRLREAFGFEGTPIRLLWRKKKSNSEEKS